LLFPFTSPCSPCSTLFPYTTLFRSHFFLQIMVNKIIFLFYFLFLRFWFIPFTDQLFCLSYTQFFIKNLSCSRILFFLIFQSKKRSEDTRLNSSHVSISYAVFCLKKK